MERLRFASKKRITWGLLLCALASGEPLKTNEEGLVESRSGVELASRQRNMRSFKMRVRPPLRVSFLSWKNQLKFGLWVLLLSSGNKGTE